MADEEGRSARNAKKYAHVSNIIIKQEIRARMKQVRVAERLLRLRKKKKHKPSNVRSEGATELMVNGILKKPTEERTSDELRILEQSPDIASAVQKRSKHRQLAKDRTQEVEDPPDVLSLKCQALAEAIKSAKTVIIYSGAGISTAASIPDYRGPNGIWTLLQKGVAIKPQDLSDAEPTITHMSITKLQQEGKVKHVVSQNCDGLHLRSGFPRCHLSEVHGNMYIELCKNCKPVQEYIRLFDVTERTAVRRHHTGRMCHLCGEELHDTIIHFGEKAPFTSPYNWEEAAEWADEADVILCLGSSLKVVRKYGCLWNLHKPFAKRPKLFIVNLQWTPKDDSATLKINGRCDDVMCQLMSILNYDVPVYDRESDPIFRMAVELYPLEQKTTSKKILSMSQGLDSPIIDDDKLANNCIDSTVTCTDSTAPCIDSTNTCIDLTVTCIDSQANCTDSPCIVSPTKHIESSISDTISTDKNIKGDSECLVKVEQLADMQIRAMLGMSPTTPLSSGDSATSFASSAATVRALIRSRLQSRMSTFEHTTVDTSSYSIVLKAHPDEGIASPERPSDKYKIIKYLLNKPADVVDEKLQQLTTHLRDSCETMILGGCPTSPSHSALIYSNADSFCQLTPLSIQHKEDPEEKGTSVKKSYPTLVGALMQQHPMCGITEDQPPAVQLHSTCTNYQNVMGGLCSSSNGDAISKLRSLMEGRPKLEPLLIETEVSTAHHVSKTDQQMQPGCVPTGTETELLLTTVLPSSDQEAMLMAYRHVDSHLDRTEAGTEPSHCSKRCSNSLDESTYLDTADMEQTENISPSQTSSMPGWFGKGLNIKKRKKKAR